MWLKAVTEEKDLAPSIALSRWVNGRQRPSFPKNSAWRTRTCNAQRRASATRMATSFPVMGLLWESRVAWWSTPGRTRDEACFGSLYRERLAEYHGMCGTKE